MLSSGRSCCGAGPAGAGWVVGGFAGLDGLAPALCGDGLGTWLALLKAIAAHPQAQNTTRKAATIRVFGYTRWKTIFLTQSSISNLRRKLCRSRAWGTKKGRPPDRPCAFLFMLF